MANIELVIKIPEEICQHYKRIWQKRRGSIPESCIAFGTPIPKGHGRLKDIDAFITKVNADRKHSAYLRSWTADDVLDALDNNYAPTIVEADTESEDNECKKY